MRIANRVAWMFLILVLGCKREVGPVQPPPQATTFSNGGFTWKEGAILMNGTNVPASNVTFTVTEDTNTTSK
jgi:hypothetical protein